MQAPTKEDRALAMFKLRKQVTELSTELDEINAADQDVERDLDICMALRQRAHELHPDAVMVDALILAAQINSGGRPPLGEHTQAWANSLLHSAAQAWLEKMSER